jgi:hypothetical protein
MHLCIYQLLRCTCLTNVIWALTMILSWPWSVGYTFDDNQNGAGSFQAQNVCLLAKYGNKGTYGSEGFPTAKSRAVMSNAPAWVPLYMCMCMCSQPCRAVMSNAPAWVSSCMCMCIPVSPYAQVRWWFPVSQLFVYKFMCACTVTQMHCDSDALWCTVTQLLYSMRGCAHAHSHIHKSVSWHIHVCTRSGPHFMGNCRKGGCRTCSNGAIMRPGQDFGKLLHITVQMSLCIYMYVVFMCVLRLCVYIHTCFKQSRV